MSGLRRALWLAGWPIRAALLAPIVLYRRTLSPLLGVRCRFHPTCSAYAEESIRRLGALRGVPLAAWRVLRCSPLSAGGIDPVPHRGPAARMDDSVIQMPEVA